MKRILISITSVLLLACMIVSCEKLANGDFEINIGLKPLEVGTPIGKSFYGTIDGGYFIFDEKVEGDFRYREKRSDIVVGKYSCNDNQLTFELLFRNMNPRSSLIKNKGFLNGTTLTITEDIMEGPVLLIPAGNYEKVEMEADSKD
ncbi:MAG: hypothetical protein ACRC5H_04800 [Treponemataceae bacterium]